MSERNYTASVLDQTSKTEPPQAGESQATESLELAENERRSIPPIYENATVITVQPQFSEHHNRRPIPINTLDWVSTPRSQLSALSGTHFLAGVEQLEIQQIVDLSTLLGTAEKVNQYRVKVPRAETIFLAMECRKEDQPKLFGFFRGAELNILDQSGETAFTIVKNPGWRYLPGPLHKITMTSTNLIGSVEQNFTVFGHSFTVYDDSRRPLCHIYGPNVCGCCMYKDAQFQVISVDGSHQIASLMHQWDNILVDYTLLVTFPVDTDIRLKSLLLGAAFLLEYLFFQRTRQTSRR